MLKSLVAIFITLFSIVPSAFSATSLNLSTQDAKTLRSLLQTLPAKTSGSSIKEVRRDTDFNQTLHLRLKQNYAGYTIWGSDVALHIKKGQRDTTLNKLLMEADPSNITANGIVFEKLQNDLNIYSPEKLKLSETKAIAHIEQYYKNKTSKKIIIHPQQNRLIIFVDKENKAHWAFRFNFIVDDIYTANEPSFIVDALTFDIYEEWNNAKTESIEGGGFGGSEKIGKLVYDGLADHLPALDVQYNDKKKICYRKNETVYIKIQSGFFLENDYFKCQKDNSHNNVYWDYEGLDAKNSAFSPGNDALYAAKIADALFQSWYKIPAYADRSEHKLPLIIETHINMDNASWSPFDNRIKLGDGGDHFYPLTSLSIISHEIGHAFTQQHSDLEYLKESGGMNESFSDMIAKATEFYVNGKNNWELGREVMKAPNIALRYMDDPKKDCETKNGTPGENCSIDHVQDYERHIKTHTTAPDVHYSSGIYNRVFYLLATSKNWDTKKAFDVMVQANRFYWISNSTFNEGACGVISATQDYEYDLETVHNAFSAVGIDTKKCMLEVKLPK